MFVSTYKPKELSFAQIAKLPRPGFQTIGSSTFLPDGSHVLYLKSSEYGSLSRQLYATEVSTGKTFPLACTPPGAGEEKELSLEEKLRRERARIMNTGVTSFKVAGSSKGKVLVPLGGALYIREGIDADAELQRLFDPQAAPLGPGPIIDPQISEDGSLVCCWVYLKRVAVLSKGPFIQILFVKHRKDMQVLSQNCPQGRHTFGTRTTWT